MKMDSIIIPFLAAILTAIVVGGAYYMNEARPPTESEAQKETSWETLKPRARENSEPTVQPSSRRTDTPIKCQDPEVGEFWTNASSCEGADLHNRISGAQVRPEIAVRDQYDDQKYEEPETASKYGSDQ